MSFLALSGRESSLVQTLCESCVHLDITHRSVHMTRRFVFQGCPTLIDVKLRLRSIGGGGGGSIPQTRESIEIRVLGDIGSCSSVNKFMVGC